VPAVILIAAGGTGGHVFPGLAVAEALGERPDVEVVFAGTPRGLEKKIVPECGYALELLDVEPIKGGGAPRAARGAAIAARASVRALGLVRRLAVRAVLSVGGYAAGPVALAAAVLRVPMAIVEPNIVAGLSNRLLSRLARRIFIAWEETGKSFPAARTELVGVPLRSGFTPRPYEPQGTCRVLVLGGSQGAAALDERAPAALGIAAKRVKDLVVVHQSGAERVRDVEQAYAREGVARATVVPFVADVASELAAADLVVARAGAGTVAEIAAIGRASILVPFPHAADDHQARNALAFARAGGAVCVRQEAADSARLALEVERLFADEPRRKRMAAAAQACGKPFAARRVAGELLTLAGLVNGSRRRALPDDLLGG